MSIGGYIISAVLFDFDGTLTRPGALDFEKIRQALECPAGMPILEYIDKMKSARKRRAALAQLDYFEVQGAKSSVANHGARRVVAWLKGQGVAVGIITRNSRASVLRALDNFDQIGADDFDMIITREDPPAPKPSAEGVLWAAERLRVPPAQILVVGDFIFDIQAGLAAGALTALLDTGADDRLKTAVCDFRIGHLDQLISIVRAGLPLAAGKLPNDLLQGYLKAFTFQDPTVVIPPGVGEDVAAVATGYDDVMVLKSDPVTFATDALGAYAVIANANDIATSGAVPRWFLTTLLLPCGVSASFAKAVMHELASNCSRWGITLCGGHTEISDAVNRPVVVGMMVGTVRRNALIHKQNMRTGDVVVMTKAAAVEGTAIIARQFASRLIGQGLSEQEIADSCGFLEQMSIMPEARLAADHAFATAMHDVTEGGVATAIEELSAAGGHRLSVDIGKIPVFKQTAKICAALNLNPLGLIGSGSLLICCSSEKGPRLIDKLMSKGIAAVAIGRVLEPGTGVAAFSQGRPAPWPKFETDEITRLFTPMAQKPEGF